MILLPMLFSFSVVALAVAVIGLSRAPWILQAIADGGVAILILKVANEYTEYQRKRWDEMEKEKLLR